MTENDLIKFGFVKEIHKRYGASIPREAFTNELYKWLLGFKQRYSEYWQNDEYIFAIANVERYEIYNYGERESEG